MTKPQIEEHVVFARLPQPVDFSQIFPSFLGTRRNLFASCSNVGCVACGACDEVTRMTGTMIQYVAVE